MTIQDCHEAIRKHREHYIGLKYSTMDDEQRVSPVFEMDTLPNSLIMGESRSHCAHERRKVEPLAEELQRAE